MKNSRTNILAGILLAVIAAAVAMFFLNRQEAKPPPSAPGYYTGPFRNKANPNIYGDDNGKMVPAPPDATPAATGAKPSGGGGKSQGL